MIGAETKFCIDCRYFRSETIECDHKNNIRLSLVTGVFFRVYSPSFLRESISIQNVCGPEGKWFQPKVEMGVTNETV